MLTVVSQEEPGRVEGEPGGSSPSSSASSVIGEIVREGARAMLAAALRAEVAACIEAHAHEVGAVEMVAPRVNDKRVDEVTGERRRFASAILPPWCRKSPKINIESTFATVRHRTKVTKGPGSKAAGIAMAFKLIEAAQDRWRAVNAPHLVALVRAGARFERGKLVERPGENPQPEAA